MRRTRHLLLLIILSAFLSACTAAPAASESMPPVVADPAPTITAEPLHTAWALGWRAHAVKNRRPLPRLAYCLGISGPQKVPARPSLTASQRVWSRYGQRMKDLAVEFTQDAKRLRQRLWHPVIVNYMDWEPIVRWYWPRSQVSNALYCIYHESGGIASNGNGSCEGLMALIYTWWNGSSAYGWKFDPHNGRLNIKYGYELFKKSGWSSWTTMRWAFPQ